MVIMEQQQDHNPYQFIVDTDHSKKKPVLPSGNSKKTRIFVVIAGIALLLIIAFVVMALISSAKNAGRETYVKAVQQQAEIIRISRMGIDRAKGTSAKNLATMVNVTLQSDQSSLNSALSKNNIKVSPKEVALGKNNATDAALTKAEQSNKFDEVFITTIQTQLKNYQKTLKSAYDQASGKKLKETLKTEYNNASLLATAKQ